MVVAFLSATSAAAAPPSSLPPVRTVLQQRCGCETCGRSRCTTVSPAKPRVVRTIRQQITDDRRQHRLTGGSLLALGGSWSSSSPSDMRLVSTAFTNTPTQHTPTHTYTMRHPRLDTTRDDTIRRRPHRSSPHSILGNRPRHTRAFVCG